MKNSLKLFPAFVVAIIGFTGCGNKNNSKNPSAVVDHKNTENKSSNENKNSEENVNNENKPHKKENIKGMYTSIDPKYDYTFILTKEDLKHYEEYTKNYDIKILQNLSPIDMAKIYIFCSLNQNWVGEYHMLNKNSIKEFLGDDSEKAWVKYDEKELSYNSSVTDTPIKDMIENAEARLSLINKGKFVDDPKNPYILFKTTGNDNMIFSFVKTKDGKLEVNNPPISFVDLNSDGSVEIPKSSIEFNN